MKKLDLLVRESIQNSLDAAKHRKSKTYVRLDVITGKYDSESLTNYFGTIGQRLQLRYPEEKYGFIAIRDSNTQGLTGSNDLNEDRSNLQKLIYQISKPQEQAGSGGSWGVGKTTFFKMGIGLVLYYSRISEGDGKYESRFAAALVEDETDNPLVTEDGYRGIAFFGKYESWPNAPKDYTVPITDEKTIGKILSIFNIAPYFGEETGTTVIMPYVNHEELLFEMTASMKPELRKPVWANNINECIKLLIQRWYAPRLANSKYEGAWLKASVNGELITHDNMHPVFTLVQELYNKALFPNEKSELFDDEIFSQNVIILTGVAGKKAGVLSTAIVNSKMFNLTREMYRNIYSYFGCYDAPEGIPVITYTRNPSMVVRYETLNSKWVPSTVNLDENRILIGLFVLNSSANITLKNSTKTILEEYIRNGEDIDHYGWNDDSVNNVVDRIAENVKNKVSSMLSQKVDNELKQRSRLTDVYTTLFLPSTNYYSSSSTGSSDTDESGKEKAKGQHGKKVGTPTKFAIISNHLLNGKRIVETHTKLGSKNTVAEYKFILKSETGLVSPKEWEESVDKPYPLKLDSFRIVKFARPRGSLITCDVATDMRKAVAVHPDFEIGILYSPIFKIPYGVSVSCREGSTIECESVLVGDATSMSFEVKYSALGAKQ